MRKVLTCALACAVLLAAQSLTVQFPTSRYAFGFSNTLQVRVPGAQHALQTADLTVQCYDTGSPRKAFEPDNWTVDPDTFDVTINFAEPQSGRCVLR